MRRYFCDDCKKLVKASKIARCKDCGDDDKEYHTSCLKKVNDEKYCAYHVKAHLDNGLIVAYLKKTWAGLNLGGDLKVTGLLDGDRNWANVEVVFPGRLLHFFTRYDNYDRSITFKHRDHVENVKVHNHAGFRKALKSMVINALERELELSRNNIRSHERGIKNANKEIKDTSFVLDVVNGKAKWPEPDLPTDAQLVQVRF